MVDVSCERLGFDDDDDVCGSVALGTFDQQRYLAGWDQLDLGIDLHDMTGRMTRVYTKVNDNVNNVNDNIIITQCIETALPRSRQMIITPPSWLFQLSTYYYSTKFLLLLCSLQPFHGLLHISIPSSPPIYYLLCSIFVTLSHRKVHKDLVSPRQ